MLFLSSGFTAASTLYMQHNAIKSVDVWKHILTAVQEQWGKEVIERMLVCACVFVCVRGEEGVGFAIMEALWRKPETVAFWVCTFTRLYHLSPFSLPQCTPCPLSSLTMMFPASTTLLPIRPRQISFNHRWDVLRNDSRMCGTLSRAKSDFLDLLPALTHFYFFFAE